MEAKLNVPLDFESLQQYRQLKAKLGKAGASHAMLRLFVELGYQAQAQVEFGVLDAKGKALLEDSLDDGRGKESVTIFQELVDCGLLVAKGEVYFCPLFVKLNPQLDPSFVPMHMKGALRSKIVRDQNKYGRNLMQFALMIPPTVFLKEDGNKMSSEEISDVMMLIRGCDNALGKAERPQNDTGFTQQLARDAFGVVKGFAPEQIDFVLRKIAVCRGHPAVPGTTEQLLGPGKGEGSKFAELATGGFCKSEE